MAPNIGEVPPDRRWAVHVPSRSVRRSLRLALTPLAAEEPPARYLGTYGRMVEPTSSHAQRRDVLEPCSMNATTWSMSGAYPLVVSTSMDGASKASRVNFTMSADVMLSRN